MSSTMTALQVAEDFELPLEIVTQKNAILAMSGAGKSNAAVVLAEELYRAGIVWVAIDPKGDWHGIRTAFDGVGDGLPIPVLGGLHGDIPLEYTAGAVIANWIADERVTCVLDVSEFDTRQQLFRFLADFATALLRRNRHPLHVFAEEADDYLPQSMGEKGALPLCVGAWQRLIKRGRNHGIGSTLISQRSSAINKDGLNMTDNLIVMRTTAPLDHKAIKPWITAHGMSAELIDSLSELEDGEAWIWSPQKLKLVQKIQFRRRWTFDSGATPDLIFDADRVMHRASIDLGALKEQMAETIERAEQNDPKVLQARIRELERENHVLAERDASPLVERVEVRVPVVPEWLAEHLDQEGDALRNARDLLGDIETELEGRAERLGERRAALAEFMEVGAVGGSTFSAEGAPAPTADSLARPASKVPSAPLNPNLPDVTLGDGPRSVLAALARFPEGLTKKRLCALIGVSPKKSTIRGYLADLRKAELINAGEPIMLTPAGVTVARGIASPLPTGPELLNHWRRELGDDNVTRKAFEALLDVYPKVADKVALCEFIGVDPAASTIRGAMATLRAHGLVDGWRLTDDFMEAIR